MPKLSETQYWKVRALVNDTRAIEVEAAQVAAGYKQRIAAAEQAAKAFFVNVGLDPAKNYRWDDAACEFTEIAE